MEDCNGKTEGPYSIDYEAHLPKQSKIGLVRKVFAHILSMFRLIEL